MISKKIIKQYFIQFFLTVFIYSVPYNATADSRDDVPLSELLSKDLEALGEFEFYTARRSATPINKTLGVTSVITADDIARRGYNSVLEVLQNVPGLFFNDSSSWENLTSRGITQTLTSFLFLIDGHAINNKSAFGVTVETVFPILADVERIEVVRGPGTVLWGGEAGLGIIHVITKSSKALENPGDSRWDAYVDYMTDHERRIASLIYREKFDDGGLMTSFKYFNSGFVAGLALRPTASGPANTFAPDELNNLNSTFDPSYEVNLKGNWKDFNFRGALTRFTNFNSAGEQRTQSDYYRNWIELGHSKVLDNGIILKSRVFLNDYQTDYFRTRTQKDFNWKHRGGGLESIAFYNLENHSLTLGASGEWNFLQYLTDNNSATGSLIQFVPNTLDQQIAVFGEWVYSGFTDWQFNLGGRLLYSDGILDSEFNFMPRVGAAYDINDQWSVKYLFNSSTIQPTLANWNGGEKGSTPNVVSPSVQRGADDPQTFNVHDIQLRYGNENITFIATLFYIEAKDIINFVGGTHLTANTVDATSKGVQFEFTHQLSKVKTYGDYTFAYAKFEDRTFTVGGNTFDLVTDRTLADDSLRLAATPKHQWNMGVDIDLPYQLMLNLHHRGYADIFTKWTTGTEYRNLGTEPFFDASLHWRNAGIKGLSATIYGKNILDNDAVTAATLGGFSNSVRRQRIGFNMKYEF
jgi:outer membrane receptor protein involved in Fe transport